MLQFLPISLYPNVRKYDSLGMYIWREDKLKEIFINNNLKHYFTFFNKIGYEMYGICLESHPVISFYAGPSILSPQKAYF
jgi:hypothetical protein